MAMSQAEKARSHTRIVAGASRLIRERGIAATSVSDVMQDAGLTHGGFYKHFSNKDALVAAALALAFDNMLADLEKAGDQEVMADALDGFQNHYLSEAHLASPGAGCPIAALSNDVLRGSGDLKASFAKGVHRTIAAFARGMRGPKNERNEAAARKLATLVGAVVIARASDPETALLMTKAARKL